MIRIRNLLKLSGMPIIVDDITLPAGLFPGLSEKIFTSRDNTIYHLYQSRYGINVLRTDERLRAVTAQPRTPDCCAWRPAARCWRSAAWPSASATGRWSCAPPS